METQNDFLTAKGYTPGTLAEVLGISYNMANSFFKGRRLISIDQFKTIDETACVSVYMNIKRNFELTSDRLRSVIHRSANCEVVYYKRLKKMVVFTDGLRSYKEYLSINSRDAAVEAWDEVKNGFEPNF